MKYALFFFLLALPLLARDIYVGRDADAPTLHHAIKLAVAGDTMHLEPKVYRDYAGFYGKKGAAGRPITLDGHGAVLEGSDPISPEQWREVSPGLFENTDLPLRLDAAVLGRWFFLWDGRMVLMGRTSKGKSQPLKEPKALQPGEWTFVNDPARTKLGSAQIYGSFFLKLPPNQKLADARIAAPMRSAGVQFSGENAHLIIKNLTCTHPYNDGFNIHGDCRDVVFENIRAIECGDDGMSAHETAEYRVNGFISVGNSTGICDTVAARTQYERVFIADCRGYDLFFLDDGRYRMAETWVLSASQSPWVITGREDKHCEMEVDNLYFHRQGLAVPGLITATAVLRGKGLTLVNQTLENRGVYEVTDEADLARLWNTLGREMQQTIRETYAKHQILLPAGVGEAFAR